MDKTNIRSINEEIAASRSMYVWSFPKAHVFDSGHRFWNKRLSSVNHVTKDQIWNVQMLFQFQQNTHHTVQSHIKRWKKQITGISYQWGYLRLNIWSGARGPRWHEQLTVLRCHWIFATKDLEGSALETGTPMRSHMYPEGWKCLRCFWIHPGLQLAGGRWVDPNLKIYLNH